MDEPVRSTNSNRLTNQDTTELVRIMASVVSLFAARSCLKGFIWLPKYVYGESRLCFLGSPAAAVRRHRRRNVGRRRRRRGRRRSEFVSQLPEELQAAEHHRLVVGTSGPSRPGHPGRHQASEAHLKISSPLWSVFGIENFNSMCFWKFRSVSNMPFKPLKV